MNIDQLKYFVEIANLGNLSNAAKKLNISQPALSKYITNLEETAKAEFFVKEKRNIVLTPAGKLYYDMATRIIKVQNQTTQTIETMLNKCTQTIRIGGSPHRGSQLVGKVYSKFIEKYPNVVIDVHEGYQMDNLILLKNNEIDLIFGSTDSLDSDEYNKLILYKDEVVLAIPSHHPLATNYKYENGEYTDIDPVLFNNDPWIVMDRGTVLNKVTETVFKEKNMSPSIIYSNKNITVINSMLNQGGGIGFTIMAYTDNTQNDIVYFSLSPKKYMYTSVFYNKGKILTDAEKFIIGLIIDADNKNPKLIANRNKEADKIYQNYLKDNL